MSGYLVRLTNGPAEGMEYETLIEPDPEIAVAPITTAVEYRLKVEATYTLTVTYASGGEQAHPGLDASAVEQGVGAFLSDLVHLQGEGITKLVVEIDSPEVTTAVESEPEVKDGD